jgi:hypothetical protein
MSDQQTSTRRARHGGSPRGTDARTDTARWTGGVTFGGVLVVLDVVVLDALIATWIPGVTTS